MKRARHLESNVDSLTYKNISNSAIQNASIKLREISSKLWENPELKFAEFEAHKYLTDFLTKEGFFVEQSFILPTGFRATYSARTADNMDDQSPRLINVCVICEYDALAVIGHACGHNLIAEAGLAAGIGLKSILEYNPKMCFKITVLGTPAEESGGGKIYFINGGAFEYVDFAMMVHPFSFNALYPNVLADHELIVTFRGKPSHAALSPWEGVNALDAAVSAYTSISHLRQHLKPTHRLCGIIKEGGVKTNIIPEKSVLNYVIRAPDKKQLEILKTCCLNCFEAAAKSSGCTHEVEILSSYSNMLTNPSLAETFRENAKEFNFEFGTTNEDKVTSPFSTDMGNVSYVVPSIHPTYCITTKCVNHSHGFTKEANTTSSHEITLKMACAMANCAIDVILNPSLLESIKSDFKANSVLLQDNL